MDTLASCINILNALAENNYHIEDIPQDGDELISILTKGITNDLEMIAIRDVNQYLSLAEYQSYFNCLPASVKEAMIKRWGDTSYDSNREKIDRLNLTDNELLNQHLHLIDNEIVMPISGKQLGNIFIGIQPSRGYDIDPTLNYHAPDLEPTHYYLAYYYWLKEIFKADVIIHVGKHGNLEWLPGKSLILSENCYPEVTLGTLPNFYPFIINDPGEGSQAKRRANAVILDHLTPPLTRAELYGELLELEALIDEYYQAQSLNPIRLQAIGNRISDLVTQTNLQQDLGIDEVNDDKLAEFLTVADGYLCELKEAQIRDGLHIFGDCPDSKQLVDLIVAIARFNSYNNLGLIDSIAQDLTLNISDYKNNLGDSLSDEEKEYISQQLKLVIKDKQENLNIRIKGDVIEYLEYLASDIVGELLLINKPPLSLEKGELREKEENDRSNLSPRRGARFAPTKNQLPIPPNPLFKGGNNCLTPLRLMGELITWEYTHQQLTWIGNQLLPNLYKTKQEITNLIRGLEGKYIASGASGAPTRGRSDVLPTGRNFYSVDIRSDSHRDSMGCWQKSRRSRHRTIYPRKWRIPSHPRYLRLGYIYHAHGR